MGIGKEVRHELLQHDLFAELKSLRSAVRETAEGYILCREGEIETLLDYLLKMPPERMKAATRLWMREARALKLKPAKGRIKDLKKIDNLLRDLLNYVIEADDVEVNPQITRKKVIAANRKAAVSTEMQAQ